MSYTPQPGTIAYRVIEYLKTLPAGAEVSTAVLGEELGIDVPSIGNSVCPPLAQAIVSANYAQPIRVANDNNVRRRGVA